MQSASSYSPTIYKGMCISAGIIFCGLMIIAWGSDTIGVGLGMRMKIEITGAAVFLGGGLYGAAQRYEAEAESEARVADLVRRKLST